MTKDEKTKYLSDSGTEKKNDFPTTTGTVQISNRFVRILTDCWWNISRKVFWQIGGGEAAGETYVKSSCYARFMNVADKS